VARGKGGSCCTIPGNSPPSATPSRARTATNDAKLRTKPKLIVRMPHTAVSNGSHMRGDIFLRTRLLGSSLGSQLRSRCMEQYGECSPRNVGCIEDTQSDCKLMVIDANVFLETEDARIADICAVDEGAEEQEGENGEDAVGGLVETRSREGKNTNRISSRLSTRRPSTCCSSTLPSLTVALSSFSSPILSLCIASPSPVLDGKRSKSPLNRAEPE
jgi:hypothetical protein